MARLSGDLTLVGYLFKPAGDGPFPGVIWNHISEQNPDAGLQLDDQLPRVQIPSVLRAVRLVLPLEDL